MLLDFNTSDKFDITPLYNRVKDYKLELANPTDLTRMLDTLNNSEDLLLNLVCNRLSSQDSMTRLYGTVKEYDNVGSLPSFRFNYDEANEIERSGLTRFARDYILVLSLEDSLDFLMACKFRTPLGAVKQRIEELGFNYKLISRQVLGGGSIAKFQYKNLIGLNRKLDNIILNKREELHSPTIESVLFELVTELRLYVVYYFTKNLVAKYKLNTGENATVLKSIGMTSGVYYSSYEIKDEDVEIIYNTYRHTLKLKCYAKSDYINRVGDDFCYL